MSLNELQASFHELVSALKTPPFNKVLWERDCQGESNLLWRYAREACRNGAAQRCQVDVQGLLEEEILRRIEGRYPSQTTKVRHLLIGQVNCILAAAAIKLQSQQEAQYIDEAAEAYANVFCSAGARGTDVGRRIAERAAHRVLLDDDPDDDPVVFHCQTWFLLDGPSSGKAVRLTAELEPGETGELFPDPIRLGLLDLGVSFLESVTAAWQFLADRWPAGMRVVWGLEKHKANYGIDGPSGGVSLAAAFRGAIEQIQLDHCVAASATLNLAGQPGKVEGGDDKRLAANKVGCDQVLFAEGTPWDSKRVEEGGIKLPQVTVVKSFEEAWEQLSAMARVLAGYHAAVRDKWRETWPRTIPEEASRGPTRN